MPILSRRLPPLNTLVVFEAAYRLRSFSRAAQEAALSQASVSRQIRQLENNLGVKLFVRQRHDVMPTEEGDTLASTVRVSLGELLSTAEQLRAIGQGKKSFTIYSDISIASSIITPYLNTFQQTYSDIQFRLLSSYEPIEKVNEDFDIGFQVGHSSNDRYDIQPIADDAIFPVCSPEFASRFVEPVTAVDLAKQPLLHIQYAEEDWPDWRMFLALFRVKEPKPNAGMIFSSYQVCLDVAEQGEGIALGWARTVQGRINEGKLVRIGGMIMHQPDSICVYRIKSKKSNPITNQIIETLRQNLNQGFLGQ